MIFHYLLAGFFALILNVTLSTGHLWAGISISPAFVEVTLDKGRPGGQFIISNTGDEEERYRINAVHFTFLKDGGVRQIPPDERSLAPWIKFNPKEFTLEPRTKRSVRFVIVPQGKLQQGEYWAAMELESLKTTIGRGKDAAGREYKLEVIPAILVPIFGKFGNPLYKGDLKEVKIVPEGKGAVLHSLVANSGEGRLLIEGEYEITNGSGKPIEKGSLGKTYLLPGLEWLSTAPIKANLPEGNCMVRIEYRSPQLKQSLTEEIRFVWKPPL